MIKVYEIPQPFSTFRSFVKQNKELYHRILMHVYSDLERRNVCHINPDEIYEELRKRGELKIGGTNRIIKIGTVHCMLCAVICGKKSENDVDYFVTSGGLGKKHLKFIITPSTL